ncbi:MAG: hypothetical protein ACLP9L_35560 [Thermoguttaceae bacterium]
MGARFWSTAGGLTLAFAILDLAAVSAADNRTGPEEAVFEMRERSALALEPGQPGHAMLTRGQYVLCGTTPLKEVKAYPKLRSKHPFYGKVKFDPDPTNRQGIEFCFVLDESGEADAGGTKDDGKQDEKANEEKAKSPDAADNASGGSLAAASARKLSHYDRLYFDFNRDLDLTNDPVVKPMKNPPWNALASYAEGRGRTVFDYLSVKFDYGPGIGARTFQILPWFMLRLNEDSGLMFFVPTVAREGTIRMGKHEYSALLAQPYVITGRFDRPYTGLYLTPLDSHEQLSYGGFDADRLSTIQRVDGELYTISSTPLGDKLKVKPYRGDLGLLQIGPGGRTIKDMAFSGSLRSATAALAVGMEASRAGQEKKVSESTLPVGDYLPSYVSVEYGSLRIALSDNYHSDGKPRDTERQRTYNIHVRKDKPFVLDFSSEPAVLFASPAKDQTFKPGDDIRVAAVLVDPTLDIMIRRLDDTTRTQKETLKFANGQESSSLRPLSLDPIVTITDSSGKTVSEGKMPFG